MKRRQLFALVEVTTTTTTTTISGAVIKVSKSFGNLSLIKWYTRKITKVFVK